MTESKTQQWLDAHRDYPHEDWCLLWPFARDPRVGRGHIGTKDSKSNWAHRVMCEMVHGPAPDDGYHAAHSCGNRRCVNPGHLNWKTQRDNQLDRRVHGTNNKSRRKITQMQADQIKALKGIETGIETAAKYGITESNVRLIQDGKTWAGTGKMHFWTDDEDRRLRYEIGQRRPLRDVATALGLSYGAVTARMYRLRISAQNGHHATKRFARPHTPS